MVNGWKLLNTIYKLRFIYKGEVAYNGVYEILEYCNGAPVYSRFLIDARVCYLHTKQKQFWDE